MPAKIKFYHLNIDQLDDDYNRLFYYIIPLVMGFSIMIVTLYKAHKERIQMIECKSNDISYF